MTETETVFTSTLACPHCGHRSEERMPDDACIFFHECRSCGRLIRPEGGHCCVFCSFGNVPCPPVQRNEDCCRG